MTAEAARSKLKSLASPAAARSAARFFKTGPGQYGEGDTFIGIKVPTLRTVSRQFRALPLDEIEALLNSPVHEERHLALMILVLQVARGDDAQRKATFDFYLRNTRFINNWDLVDCSAPQVVGGFLLDKSKKPLFKLAKSASLWERRGGTAGASRPGVRHHREADAELGAGRAGRRRGRRSVEGVDRAGDEVRADITYEVMFGSCIRCNKVPRKNKASTKGVIDEIIS